MTDGGGVAADGERSGRNDGNLIGRAAEAVAAGRYLAAIRLLEDAPRDLPGRDAVLGAAHLGRKKPQPALDHLLRATASGDDGADPATLLLLGRAYLLAADPGAAIRLLEALAGRWGASAPPELADVLAAAYRRDARYEDVLALVAASPDPGLQRLYEKALCQNSLGDGPGALSTWDAVLAIDPDFAAAWYGSHGPALEVCGWPEAGRRLVRAASCSKANGKYNALAAAYDLLAGREPRPFDPRHAHFVEGARALVPDLAPGMRLFGLSSSLLRWALARAARPGMVLEFGVRRGHSLAVIAAAAGQEVHGFDSFEGLPESWGSAPRGVLSTGGERPVAGPDVHLHAGWFEDTLPAFLATRPGEPVRFANIDSDIYSSARTVLQALGRRIGPGTVLVFDEFIGNRTWRQDEFRAFHEFAAGFGVRGQIIAVNPACKQVAMIIAAG